MAQVQPVYVVHPSGSVTASALATLYGLSVSDYITGPVDAHTWHRYIHLYVRSDGRYQPIKTLLGNVDGTAFYTDLQVQPRTDKLFRRRTRYYY